MDTQDLIYVSLTDFEHQVLSQHLKTQEKANDHELDAVSDFFTSFVSDWIRPGHGYELVSFARPPIPGYVHLNFLAIEPSRAAPALMFLLNCRKDVDYNIHRFYPTYKEMVKSYCNSSCVADLSLWSTYIQLAKLSVGRQVPRRTTIFSAVRENLLNAHRLDASTSEAVLQAMLSLRNMSQVRYKFDRLIHANGKILLSFNSTIMSEHGYAAS